MSLAEADSMIAAVQGNVVHIPTELGAVVLTYNLPSLGATKLQMDGATIAETAVGGETVYRVRIGAYADRAQATAAARDLATRGYQALVVEP